MNQKELKELVEFLIEKDISEFELERGDVKVKIKRAGETSHAPAPMDSRYFTMHAAPSPGPELTNSPSASQAPPASPAKLPVEENLHMVRSPIVGTYYESPSPGSPPFVKVGDVVEAGQVLCLVEAMKLMNEIESDASGEIAKMLVTNGQPIEYGQELFALRKRG